MHFDPVTNEVILPPPPTADEAANAFMGGGGGGPVPPMGEDDNAVPGGTTTVAKKKTSRKGQDIQGIDKFRSVCLRDGLPKLHAMIQRNPVIMYAPPQPTEEEKQHLLRVIEENDPTSEKNLMISDNELLGDGPTAQEKEEELLRKDAIRQQAMMKLADCNARSLYHRKQLDALVHTYYEFNHTTFVKIPMKNTQQLLSRLGKEQIAHVTEFEMHLRAKRQREDDVRSNKIRRDEETVFAQAEYHAENLDTQIQLAEQRQSQWFGGGDGDVTQTDSGANMPASGSGGGGASGLPPDDVFDEIMGMDDPYAAYDDDDELMQMAQAQINEGEMALNNFGGGGFPGAVHETGAAPPLGEAEQPVAVHEPIRDTAAPMFDNTATIDATAAATAAATAPDDTVPLDETAGGHFSLLQSTGVMPSESSE